MYMPITMFVAEFVLSYYVYINDLNGFVKIQIQNAMYSLPQAGILVKINVM